MIGTDSHTVNAGTFHTLAHSHSPAHPLCPRRARQSRCHCRSCSYCQVRPQIDSKGGGQKGRRLVSTKRRHWHARVRRATPPLSLTRIPSLCALGGSNQFDPVLSVTSFVSRRFGLAGGLAVVALLASTEGNEILKSLGDKGPIPGSGEVITTATGLAYKDVLIGTTGDQVGVMGSIVGIRAKVSIADKVLYDTAGEKPIAFRFGKRPFENVLCEGVEQGVKGMKVGGVRELTVPASLAPKGLQAQLEAAGQPLIYTVEVTEGARLRTQRTSMRGTAAASPSTDGSCGAIVCCHRVPPSVLPGYF